MISTLPSQLQPDTTKAKHTQVMITFVRHIKTLFSTKHFPKRRKLFNKVVINPESLLPVFLCRVGRLCEC